ncbi:MAG TPA: L,D-transpeptidase [Patescibacteria group bacterium]|nr:L,D-transpeptidase [Patescibacteria group bacterium]
MNRFLFLFSSCSFGIALAVSPVLAASKPDGLFDPLIFQNSDGITVNATQAFNELKKRALIVTPAQLERIPLPMEPLRYATSTNVFYAGKILRTVQDSKHIWFVARNDGRRYMFDGTDGAFPFFQSIIAQSFPQQKWIFISLSTQTLEERLGMSRLSEYKISSGKALTPTPTGFWSVRNKVPMAWSKMAGLWMPDWMAFTPFGHGIHELPIWPSGYREGEAHLGTPVSHGCVRLGLLDAKSVYDWAEIGTPVVVVQ